VTDENWEEYVLNDKTTAEILALLGIVDKSKLAHPLFPEELILIKLPSFFVPVEFTEPVLKELVAPVAKMSTLTCPQLSTLNKEKSKLSASINEVMVDFFDEAALDTDVVEIVRELITACAERRIVVIFIVSGLKYSFGSPNLENKMLRIKDNEHLLVEKKQEGGFIEY
jgi:hypothetical protein